MSKPPRELPRNGSEKKLASQRREATAVPEQAQKTSIG